MANTIRLPNASRSAGVGAILDLIDAGEGPGYVEVYTGEGPADPDDAATGTLLVTITLNDPAFGAPADGVRAISTDPVLTVQGVGDGEAGWCRFFDSDDTPVMDGDVSQGPGGVLQLDNTNIATGQNVTITGGTVTMSDGA
jgi:hypothetical protein